MTEKASSGFTIIRFSQNFPKKRIQITLLVQYLVVKPSAGEG